MSFITVERIYKQFISVELNNKSTEQHCVIEVTSSLQERTRLSVCQIHILSRVAVKQGIILLVSYMKL